MVSVNLVGRMANQMFQISCCIAYALRSGLEYHIPAHTQNDNVWKPIFTHLENPDWNPKLPTIQIREESHAYAELLPAKKRISMVIMEQGDVKDDVLVAYNVVIDGYRQSIKYFQDYLPEVRKAFGFDCKPKEWGHCAAIHVRRGDYKLYPTKHPCVTEEYLLVAINKMMESGVDRFTFFSDDIEWCKMFFAKYNNLICPTDGDRFDVDGVSFSEGKTELEDFQHMLSFPNLIISNSTYSLMAAILSESKHKIVISPDEDNWFGVDNKHLSVVDLIPKEFIKIKY